jgi:hypothetical protein
MKAKTETNAQVAFEDPRRRSDFQPQYYPRANGKDAPPVDVVERNDHILLEFVAAYYDLNCRHSRLLEARAKGSSAARTQAEIECLQEIEKALIVIDGLEDCYAPYGVIAEPVVKRGFTVDMKVSFGNVDAAGRRRSDLYTITACVPIPLPTGINLKDLPIKIEGPGI